MLKGKLDHAAHDAIRGWAFEADTPDDPVRLTVSVNGELLQRIVANRYRPDLDGVGLGNGRHAFNLDLLQPLDWSAEQVVSVRREVDGAELPGSPIVLPPAIELDDAKRQFLARLIQSAKGDAEIMARIRFLTGQVEALLRDRSDEIIHRRRREAVASFRRRWGELPATAQSDKAFRALVLDVSAPEAARDAGSNVLFSHMASLQRLGYEVAFASLEPPTDAAVAGLEALGVSCCREPWFATPEDALKQLGRDLELVYLHRVETAAAYLPLARRYARRARVVYCVADLHHVRFARLAEAERRPDFARLSEVLRVDELVATVRADVVLTHSSYELELLRHAAPRARAELVRWAVQPVSTPSPAANQAGLAFIGSYLHRPNVLAARRLVEDILPEVQAANPSIVAILVGAGMPEGLRLAKRPGLATVGRIADLRAVFERVRLTVAPLTVGAGAKGKVIDSFAAGVPCLCTPVAAEGLDLPEALSPLIVDVEDFAAAILRLHADPGLLQSLAEIGLAYVRDHFSPARLDAALAHALTLPDPSSRAPLAADAVSQDVA